MNSRQQLDKGISEIVGVFCDPIIVFPGGWADTLPDWLKEAITLERLLENVRALKDGDMTGSDAEACAYLMTLSLTQPMDSDWTQIYLYIAGKVYEKHRTKDSGATMPEDIRVDSLNDYQMRELNSLKHEIYETRARVRQDRDRADRREKREQEIAKKDAEQPALFKL